MFSLCLCGTGKAPPAKPARDSLLAGEGHRDIVQLIVVLPEQGRLPMPWVRLASVVEFAFLVWFGLLALTVVAGILRRKIRTVGILTHRTSEAGRQIVPERVTLLLVTLAYAGFYVLTALRTPLDPLRPSLPNISDAELFVLFGSNGLYLAGKINDAWKGGI